MKSIKLTIHSGFLFYLAAMLLLLPLPWLAGALLAGLIHELSHILVLKLMCIPVDQITLEAGGAKIRTMPMLPWQETLCAAAGPVSGFLLGMTFSMFPRLAVCALIQSVFNILPLLPFDGGRVLRGVLQMLFGQAREEKLRRVIEVVVWVGLGILALLTLRVSFFLPVLLAIPIFQGVKNRIQPLDKFLGDGKLTQKRL